MNRRMLHSKVCFLSGIRLLYGIVSPFVLDFKWSSNLAWSLKSHCRHVGRGPLLPPDKGEGLLRSPPLSITCLLLRIWIMLLSHYCSFAVVCIHTWLCLSTSDRNSDAVLAFAYPAFLFCVPWVISNSYLCTLFVLFLCFALMRLSLSASITDSSLFFLQVIESLQ